MSMVLSRMDQNVVKILIQLVDDPRKLDDFGGFLRW